MQYGIISYSHQTVHHIPLIIFLDILHHLIFRTFLFQQQSVTFIGATGEFNDMFNPIHSHQILVSDPCQVLSLQD